jgi:hypothetical protein
MVEMDYDFWNDWSETYQGFSETIEPYRNAQRLLAQGAITALGSSIALPNLSVIDVGGGAGNLISPLLETLMEQRGHLRGVRYTLTDGAKDMTSLAENRLNHMKTVFPDVNFQILHLDTLAYEFQKRLGIGEADLVINSWNIEYFLPEKQREIVQRLVSLVHPQGVVAFSSSVRLPDQMSMRDILMPLGQAQVLQALVTGGLPEMSKVITSLKQISKFGLAVTSSHFPEKPTLTQLRELAEQAGLGSISAGYHLFGASGMIVARKDQSYTLELPKSPIVRQLSGKQGYEGIMEIATFWSYFKSLVRNPPRSSM